MQLNQILTHITSNCPDIKQVALADRLSRTTIDTSKIIADSVKDTMEYRVYPLVYPERINYPSLIYSHKDSGKIKVGGIDVLQYDIIVVSFRSKDFNELVELRALLQEEILSYNVIDNAGIIEITGETTDYLEDSKAYEYSFELVITHLMGENQQIPAVFIYHDKDNGAGKPRCGKQTIEHQINLIIICRNNEVETVREALKNCMIGYQPTPHTSESSLIAGSRADSTGSLILWEDAYLITDV